MNEITAIGESTGTAWVDPVHDRAGNLTTLPKPSSLSSSLTCTWDAWNHLVEVSDSGTVVARYEYDGLARRVKKHLDSQSPDNPDGIDAYEHFFYNGAWQVLETRRSASENTGPESLQPQYQYVWSPRYIDAPVLRDENTDADGLCDDVRIYYLGDANFNVTTLVDTAGDALERYVYSPYGVLAIYDATWSNLRSASSYAAEYTYTGRRLDRETGLYYYRHRVYHSQLGRFGSRDPIGYEGSQWNFYEYVGGNSLTFTDPLGREFQKPMKVQVANCMMSVFIGHTTFAQPAAANSAREANKDMPCYSVGVIACMSSAAGRIVPIPRDRRIPGWPTTMLPLPWDSALVSQPKPLNMGFRVLCTIIAGVTRPVAAKKLRCE